MKIRKRKINLRYAFIYLDSSQDIIRKEVKKKIRALSRLEGSSKEELNDLSMYRK